MTNRPAFTLVELLLGVAVSSIIFISATSAYVFLLKTSSKLNQSQSLEQAKNDLFQELSNAIRWAPKGTISISDCPGLLHIGSTEYKLESNILSKNGQPLVPPAIHITNFTCNTVSPLRTDYQTLNISITLKDTTTSRQDALDFIVSQRQTDFTHSDAATPMSTPIPTPTPVVAGITVPNGGFELGILSGWTSTGTTEISSPPGPVHSGTKSASIVGGNYVSQNVKTLLTAGVPYTFTMYYRVTADDPAAYNGWGSPRLTISKNVDLGSTEYGFNFGVITINGTWASLTASHIFTDTELLSNVYVGITNFGFNGTTAVDDLTITSP